MKGLAASVQSALDAYYNGEFPGGQGLHMELLKTVSNCRWKHPSSILSQEDYDKVFAALASGEIVLKKDVDENGNELTLMTWD